MSPRAACRLETLGFADVRDYVAESRYGFALVVSVSGILLGRVGRSALGGADDTVEAVMEPGPSTIRANVTLYRLLERMRSRDVTSLPVTTPDGGLLGVVRREDLER